MVFHFASTSDPEEEWETQILRGEDGERVRGVGEESVKPGARAAITHLMKVASGMRNMVTDNTKKYVL